MQYELPTYGKNGVRVLRMRHEAITDHEDSSHEHEHHDQTDHGHDSIHKPRRQNRFGNVHDRTHEDTHHDHTDNMHDSTHEHIHHDREEITYVQEMTVDIKLSLSSQNAVPPDVVNPIYTIAKDNGVSVCHFLIYYTCLYPRQFHFVILNYSHIIQPILHACIFQISIPSLLSIDTLWCG